MNKRRQLLQLAISSAVANIAGVKFAQSNESRATRLLFVHGRAQEGKNPEVLKTDWIESLQRGAKKSGQSVSKTLTVAFPYYGDVLDYYAKKQEIPLTTDIQTKGSIPDSKFLEFQAAFAEQVRLAANVTDDQVSAEFADDVNERGPQNWKWVQAILRALDKHGGGMSQKTLETFTRDVYLYTTLPGVKAEIDDIVVKQLTTEPTVIVAHSLGTVVAYGVLRSDRRDLHIPLYVTVGSPLAVRSVRDQFKPLRFPPHVQSWYNAFDRRDVVSLYPLDSNNFPVNPSIENYNGVDNYTDNRHGIIAYLDDKTVANRILNSLISD